MPYINNEQRDKYNDIKKSIDNIHEIETKGDLEYLVFVLMIKYMSTRDFRYSTLHDTVYATIHSAEEFKRRYLDNRENEAMIKNGDI